MVVAALRNLPFFNPAYTEALVSLVNRECVPPFLVFFHIRVLTSLRSRPSVLAIVQHLCGNPSRATTLGELEALRVSGDISLKEHLRLTGASLASVLSVMTRLRYLVQVNADTYRLSYALFVRTGATDEEDVRDMCRAWGSVGFLVAHPSEFDLRVRFAERVAANLNGVVNYELTNSSIYGGMMGYQQTVTTEFNSVFASAFGYAPLLTASSAGTLLNNTVFGLANHFRLTRPVVTTRTSGIKNEIRGKILVFGDKTYLDIGGPFRGESALGREGDASTHPAPEIVRVNVDDHSFFAHTVDDIAATVPSEKINGFISSLTRTLKDADIGCCVLECVSTLGTRQRIWRRPYLVAVAKALREAGIPILEDSTLSVLRTGKMLVFQHAQFGGFLPDFILAGKALGVSCLAVRIDTDTGAPVHRDLPLLGRSTASTTHLELLKGITVMQLFQETDILEHVEKLGAALKKHMLSLNGVTEVNGFGCFLTYKVATGTAVGWRSGFRRRLLPPLDLPIDRIADVFVTSPLRLFHVGFCVHCGRRPGPRVVDIFTIDAKDGEYDDGENLTECRTCPNAYHTACVPSGECPDCMSILRD